MKDDMIGIAKRNLKKGELIELPTLADGEIGCNDSINFVEGTNIGDLL